MRIPIHEKYMLSVTECAEYFGICAKRIRRLILEHPEICIWYGNKWIIIREKAEAFFSDLPANEEGQRELR